MDFKLLNEQQMIKAFKQAETQTLDSVNKGLERVGQQGVTMVKQQSPVISGRLRGSMGYTIGGKVEMAEGDSKDVIRPHRDKDMVIIGTNVVYAPRVEYLSQTGSKGFMNRAFNQLRSVVNQLVGNEIKARVGK